jgi:hypothetical protein
MVEMIKTKNLVIVALGLSGLVFGSAGKTTGAVFVAVFLLLNIYRNLKFENGGLLAVGAISAFAILFASTLYIFGQYAQPMSHLLIRTISYLVLIFFCLKSENSNSKNHFRRNFFGALGFSMFTYSCSIIPSARLITFLGFGYDNYGHFYLFRNTLVHRHAFIALKKPDEFVTFAGATPLATHNLLALIAETIGIDGGRLHQSLVFFSLVACLIPGLIILIAYLAIKSTETSKVCISIGTLLVGVVILLGYPSHIWFSGYLTSNFSTFLMVTGVCIAIFCKSSSSKIWILAYLSAGQFLVYPLYSIFAIIPIVSLIISSRGKILIAVYKEVRENIMETFVLTICISGLILITLNGMLSGFNGGQFLTPGGIAPLPVGTTMFIFGISIALSINSEHRYCDDSTIRIIICGISALALAGISYSLLKTNEPGKLWVPSYYPTKLAISVLIVLITLLIVQIVQKIETGDSRIRHSLNALLVVAAISALVVSSYNSWPFSQGYMGTTQGVIKSLKSGTSEVVDGDHILQVYESVRDSNMSVLYLSDTHESELNTRWINTLNLNWTDNNWGEWITARQLIDDGNLDDALKIVDPKFVLVIDNYARFETNAIAFGAFNNMCVFDSRQKINCR